MLNIYKSLVRIDYSAQLWNPFPEHGTRRKLCSSSLWKRGLLENFLPDFCQTFARLLPDYLISPQFSIRFTPNSTIS